jgi:hypothetical protein
MGRYLSRLDLISVNIYFLGLATVAQTNGLVFPLLVQQFVGKRARAFGTLRFLH